MAFDYAATAATATRLLQRFGAAAPLKRQTAGAYNPATGAAPVTVTSLATTAAVFDYPQRYVDGTLIHEGDKQAFMAPAVVPAQGDVLTWQGVDYQVISVKGTSPAGVAVLYEVQIRG